MATLATLDLALYCTAWYALLVGGLYALVLWYYVGSEVFAGFDGSESSARLSACPEPHATHGRAQCSSLRPVTTCPAPHCHDPRQKGACQPHSVGLLALAP